MPKIAILSTKWSFQRSLIYRDEALSDLAGIVRRKEPLRFIDRHTIKKGVNASYFVVSVDRFGNVSTRASVVIKKKMEKQLKSL